MKQLLSYEIKCNLKDFAVTIKKIKITVSENEKFSQNSLYSSSQSSDFVENEFDEPAAIEFKP